MQQPVRVLLIDGSVSFRHSLTEGLRSYLPSGSRIESVGDSYAAQAMCVRFQPHLLAMTYDLAIRMVNTDSNLKILSQATKLPILVYSVPLDKRLALISDGARDCVSASSTGERSQSYYKAFALKIMMLDEVKAMQRASRPVAGSVSNVNQNPRAGFVSSRAPAGFDAPRRKTAAAETLEKQLANMSFAPRKGK